MALVIFWKEYSKSKSLERKISSKKQLYVMIVVIGDKQMGETYTPEK